MFSIDGEFLAEIVHTGIHVVVFIVPEGVEHFLQLFVLGYHFDALAQDEADGDFDHGHSQGVSVVGLVALVVDFQERRTKVAENSSSTCTLYR